MRALKVLFVAWALAVGAAMVLFLVVLWASGPQTAERMWVPLPLSILFVIGLIVSARFLR